MGEIKGFLKVKRETAGYRPVCERLKDYWQVCLLPGEEQSKDQASRCMDCGIPFCHWGCPIGNYIPEWNDYVFKGQLEKAYELLSGVNIFPEITGRLCPAFCEYACVLGINDEPVTIRENELAIIEQAFIKGIVKPRPPKKRTKKKVAIVGSGPAGLACADQLNKAGHLVTVFEKDAKIGGMMRYGIPDFKLEKWVLERRIKILEREGIKFKPHVIAGTDYPVSKLRKEFDALCLACGSRQPRDLNIEGRNLRNIYFAMDFLTQSNRRVAGEKIPPDAQIDAKRKKVVVIGGGDTGADCVGLAHRQNPNCVIQIELLPPAPTCRPEETPWPKYPMLLKTSSSHEEGGERKWQVLTKEFLGENGQVKKLSCAKVDFSQRAPSGCPVMKEVPGSNFEIEADLVILAMGFLYPEKKGLIEELGLVLDALGNVRTDETFTTSEKGIFSCGDMRRGQSLVVWAVHEGRSAAHHIDTFLTGSTQLPLF